MTNPSSAFSSPALAEIERVANLLGVEDVAQRARTLAERLSEGRFYVACIGQFKRGKSTLLNALVGDAVLPTGVVPVTSVVTVLRHGDQRAARVKLKAQRWAACDVAKLGVFITEEQNPGNRKTVEAVEVFLPAPLLTGGMCLVDTPGVGSVFEDNSAATHAFVPHVDAAIVVLGADPPISAAELRLIGDVSARVEHLIFVLNKADRVSEAERQQGAEFCRRMLRERLGKSIPPLLEVSATERLSGAGPERDWPRLLTELSELVRRTGAELVHAAEERGAQSLANDLRRELAERRAALKRPITESQRRIAALRKVTERAEEVISGLGPLLSGEQARLSRTLADDTDRFLARALPAGCSELPQELGSAPASPSDYRQRAVTLTVEVARHWIERWRQEKQPEAEERYRKTARRFVELAAGVQAEISQLPGLEVLPPLSGDEAVHVRSRFQFTEMLKIAPESTGRRLLDAMGSFKRRVASVDRDAVEYLSRLLEVNGTRIRNDFEERILESRRRLERDLRVRLGTVLAIAERSLRAAEAAHSAGQTAVSRSREAATHRIRVERAWPAGRAGHGAQAGRGAVTARSPERAAYVVLLTLMSVLAAAAAKGGDGPRTTAIANTNEGDASQIDRLCEAFIQHDRPLLARDATLVAGKYARMAKSPFAFFRGTAWLHLREPSAFDAGRASRVAIVGDPHPENVGTVAHGGAVFLQFNDFDLAGYGSYVDDLRRLSLGLWIIADMAHLKPKRRAKIVLASVDGYVAEVRALSRGTRTDLTKATDVFGDHLDEVLNDADEDEPTLPPASASESELAHVVIARYLTGDHPASSWLAATGAERARSRSLKDLFAIKRVMRRNAGVASFPVLRLQVVVEGPTAAADDDWTLEIKASSGTAVRAIVAIQRQFNPPPLDDPFLGWAAIEGREFRVKSVSPSNRRLDASRIARGLKTGRIGKEELQSLAFVLGELLARGHGSSPAQDGKPAKQAIASAMTSEQDLRRETLSYVERSGPAVNTEFRLFLVGLTERGPVLDWTGRRH